MLTPQARQTLFSSPWLRNLADDVLEEAVGLFLKGSIGFTDIPLRVEAALEAVTAVPVTALEDVLAAERSARAHVLGTGD